MSDIHITREILRAVSRGDLPLQILREIGWQHLLNLCPTCEREYRAWQVERGSGRDPRAVLPLLPRVFERHREDERRARRTADREAEDLMNLPFQARLAKVEGSYRRYRGVFLARRLLEESKKRMTTSPAEAEELAETAVAVLMKSPASPDLPGLMALAAVYRANVARLLGRPDEARQRFEKARAIIRSHDVTDLLIFGEMDACEALLELELRDFPKAQDLLKRSISIYMLAGAREKVAYPLFIMGRLHNAVGDPMTAVEVTRGALKIMNRTQEPRLFVFAHLNIALFLHEAGRHAEAVEALAEAREQARAFPDAYTQVRITWLEGKLAAALDDLEGAEKTFLEVREDLIARGQRYDAAMVSLDLASLYLRQNRTADLMTIAEEMHALFTAEEVHREALAALLVFQEAARKEQLTAEAVQRFLAVLKRLRS